LGIRRHLESDEKLSFCEIYPTKIQAQIIKQNAKMFKTQNGQKASFAAILKITAILKACEKNFQFFLQFLSYHIYTKCD
jgi:hypothetical protein